MDFDKKTLYDKDGLIKSERNVELHGKKYFKSLLQFKQKQMSALKEPAKEIQSI